MELTVAMRKRLMVYAIILFSSAVYVSSCFKVGLDTGSIGTIGNYQPDSSNYQPDLVIGIKDHIFSPDILFAKQNVTVTWYNYDLDAHIVTSDDKRTFKNDIYLIGATSTTKYTFSYMTSVAGVFNYHCSIHQGETGVLIINPVGTIPNIVGIKNRKFNPDTITVNQGMTVNWINFDPFTHTVRSNDNLTFNIDSLVATASAANYGHSIKTSVAGTFNYHCSIHPSETGVLIVNPPSHVIEIKDHNFTPGKFSVKQGDIVIWYNYDPYTHIVTSDDNVTFRSDTIFGCGTKISIGYFCYYSYRVSIADTFKYHCRIHPSETGILIVHP